MKSITKCALFIISIAAFQAAASATRIGQMQMLADSGDPHASNIASWAYREGAIGADFSVCASNHYWSELQSLANQGNEEAHMIIDLIISGGSDAAASMPEDVKMRLAHWEMTPATLTRAALREMSLNVIECEARSLPMPEEILFQKVSVGELLSACSPSGLWEDEARLNRMKAILENIDLRGGFKESLACLPAAWKDQVGLNLLLFARHCQASRSEEGMQWCSDMLNLIPSDSMAGPQAALQLACMSYENARAGSSLEDALDAADPWRSEMMRRMNFLMQGRTDLSGFEDYLDEVAQAEYHYFIRKDNRNQKLHDQRLAAQVKAEDAMDIAEDSAQKKMMRSIAL